MKIKYLVDEDRLLGNGAVKYESSKINAVISLFPTVKTNYLQRSYFLI